MKRDLQFILGRTRKSRRTLYMVAGLYVLIGLILALASAVSGDRLSTFLGFLIVTGAIAAAGFFNLLMKLMDRLHQIGERVSRVEDRFERIESALNGQLGRRDELHVPPVARSGRHLADRVALLNLARIGTGDASPLTAAVLKRDCFPRLARMLDEQELVVDPAGTPESPAHLPASSDETGHSATDAQSFPPPAAWPVEDQRRSELRFVANAKGGLGGDVRLDTKDAQATEAPLEAPNPLGPGVDRSAVTSRDLLRDWQEALRDGDLATCRRVYATMVDMSDASEVEPLRLLLADLAERTEAELREEFASCVRRHDFAEALEVGQRIAEILPHSPIHSEFEHLRPHLVRRLHATAAELDEALSASR